MRKLIFTTPTTETGHIYFENTFKNKGIRFCYSENRLDQDEKKPHSKASPYLYF